MFYYKISFCSRVQIATQYSMDCCVPKINAKMNKKKSVGDALERKEEKEVLRERCEEEAEMVCDEKKKNCKGTNSILLFLVAVVDSLRALNELPRAALAEAKSLDAPTAMAVALP